MALPQWIGLLALAASGAAAAGIDHPAWNADYTLLKAELEKSYSHLAWFASPQSGVNIPALDRRTQAALDSAQTDAEARLAIRDFVTSFHDGHFSELPAVESNSAAAGAEPARRDLTHDDPISGCAALGYADRSQVAFSLPFESLPGFALQSDGVTSAFRAGVIGTDGKRIGIIRIKNFSMRQYPSECARAWKANPKVKKSDSAFDDLVTDAWFESLSRRLAKFRADKVDLLIVDVGSNSGGNDSGDWAPRLFTSKPVQSARLFMAAAPVGATYLDEQIGEVRKALLTDSSKSLRAAGQRALDSLTSHKAELAERHCPMSWAWSEQRSFDPTACSRLVDVGFASGPLASLASNSYRDRRAAAKIYWPATVHSWQGSWNGTVYVLTNATAYSAAEMFSAVMKDNGIAKTVGTRTGGDGCGFMEDTDPVVLPHSQLRFRIPNCVRLRKDGSDEVAGIPPDLPINALEHESPRARAARLLQTVVRDSSR
jgi:hypothetical protein